VVVDVSAGARRRRNQATRRLVVRLIGVSIAFPAALPSLWRVARLLAGGAARQLAAAALHAVPHSVSPFGRRVFTGRNPLRVAVHLAVATALVLIGLFVLATVTALIGTTPTVADAGGSSLAGLKPLLPWVGVALLALGTLAYRKARRAGRWPRRLMRRDPRPIVLFLRSFRDDSLRLRTAVVGRRSLIGYWTLAARISSRCSPGISRRSARSWR
jgi:hypothetical protein